MSEYLTEYNKILKDHTEGKLSTKQFLKKFYELFNNDEFQKNATSSEFEIINGIWEWTEAYEPRKEIRGNVYIDGNQLKEKIKEYQEKIKNKLKNKYSKTKISEIIRGCIDNKISSKSLGKWTFNAWYYYMEGKGKNDKIDKKMLDILNDISNQWNILESKEGKNAFFQKKWLEKWLEKVKGLDGIK